MGDAGLLDGRRPMAFPAVCVDWRPVCTTLWFCIFLHIDKDESWWKGNFLEVLRLGASERDNRGDMIPSLGPLAHSFPC